MLDIDLSHQAFERLDNLVKRTLGCPDHTFFLRDLKLPHVVGPALQDGDLLLFRKRCIDDIFGTSTAFGL